jgi:TonB family protein
MTMPLSSSAFDVATAHPLAGHRMAQTQPQSRAFAIAVTVALHVAVALGLIAGVHVSTIKLPPALMVHISLDKPKVAQDVAPPPVMQKPSAVVAPPPEVVIQTAPSPIMVAPQPVVTPAPPPPVAAPQKETGQARESFEARLLSQLNRFKQYPRAARQAHIEGVVMLHFVMDADGKVLSAEIAKSSGRPLLDGEALALIRRAQPLPALPADFPTRTLDAVVPIAFSLNS